MVSNGLIAMFQRLPDYKQKRPPSLLAFLSDEATKEYNQDMAEFKKELEKPWKTR